MIGRTIISRIAGAIAVPIALVLFEAIGISVTEEQASGFVDVLTEGLTGLGMTLGLATYGITHRITDKKVNPADAAARSIADLGARQAGSRPNGAATLPRTL